MSDHLASLIVWGAAGLAISICWWRRAGEKAAAEILRGPERTAGWNEPCWTEQVASDGRFSYGRYGCFHEELKEADARARGEGNAHG